MTAGLAPPLYMAGAALLFALMGALVKQASLRYGAGEMVFYRSLIGFVLMLGIMRARGVDWRTRVAKMHIGRSVTGTVSMCLWFVSLQALPLATAMTLNIMSSVWIAMFLMVSALLARPGHAAVDARLVAAVVAGFIGVALVLQPTIEARQIGGGVAGLCSGLLAATAYLQVTALGRAGEPGERVVLYFSASGMVIGTVLALATGGMQQHTLYSALLLLGIGVLATVAQWMLTLAYASGATLGIASLQYLGIGFAFLIGVGWFGDPVTNVAMAGMVLIIGAGVAAIFLRPSTRRPARPSSTP